MVEMIIYKLRSYSILPLLLTVGFITLPPIFYVLYGSFVAGSPLKPAGLTFEGYIAFTGSYVQNAIVNSFTIAVVKTCIAIPIAFLLAWLTTRTDLPAKGVVETLIPAALLMPGFVTALVWILLLSPSIGLINARVLPLIGLKDITLNIYSLWGIVWVQSTLTVPYAYLILASALRNVDPSTEEAARISGGGTFHVLRTITFPLVRPAFLSVLILSVVLGIEAFDIPLLIGGPARIPVMTTEIYRRATFLPPDYTSAAALSWLALLSALILVTLQRRYISQEYRFATITARGFKPPLIKLGKWKYLASLFVWSLLTIYIFLPVAMLLIVSLFRGYPFSTFADFTLDRFSTVWGYPMVQRALINTFTTAISVGFIATIVALFVVYCITRTNLKMKSILDNLSMLPLAVPSIVLSLGFLWAYIASPLWGTVWVLILAFLAKGLPWGVRATIGGMVQIDKALEESSRVCGAGWLHTFIKIVCRLLSGTIIASILLIIIFTVRELALPSLLKAYGSEFISVLLLEMWTNGYLAETTTLSFILIVFIILLTIILKKVFKTTILG
jgi:iron(III) transport system permease protein